MRLIVKPMYGVKDLIRNRILLAASVALICLLAAFTPSLAHAIVQRSEPADGAVLDKPPAQVKLWFSEAITPNLSQARVLDAQGDAVQGVRAQVDPADPTLMIVALPPLPRGAYNVAFDILSADDGHADQGSLTFTTGAPASGTAAARPSPILPPATEILLRWFNFAALAGLAGGLAVIILVLPGGSHARTDVLGIVLAQARRRVIVWAAWCSIAALAAGLGLLAWQTAQLAPSGPDRLPRLLLDLIGGTSTGRLWLARQTLLVVIAGVLFSHRRRHPGGHAPWPAPAVLAAGSLLTLAVLATQALSSHAAALPTGAFQAILADLIHLVAASLWAGGLLALAVSLLPLAWSQTDPAALSALLKAGWRPFSGLAALSVGLLIATGLYSLGRQVASPDALLATPYGQALLAKSALVLGAGVCGLLNAMLLHPRLAAPLARLLRRPAGWAPFSLPRLPYLVMAEATLALLVLLATGVITSSSPARGPQFAPQPAGTETLGDHIGDLILIFHADPNQVGTNTFTVDVLDHQGPAKDVSQVSLRFFYLGHDLGAVSADAQPVSAGKYQIKSQQISLAGPWQADVVVRRRGHEDTVAHFRWTAPVTGHHVLLSDRPLEPVLTPVAAAILPATLLIGAFVWLRRAQATSGRAPARPPAERGSP